MRFLRQFALIVLLGMVVVVGVWAQQPASSQQPTSLGDYARKIREAKKPDAKVTSTDASELFAALDMILDFASRDSGYAKRDAVKRKLMNHDDLEKKFAEWSKRFEVDGRIQNSELVLKKFGLLPQDYDLNAFLHKNPTQGVAGMYDDEDKTMYLMDWVSVDQQKPVMAHELTHALQDQNYNLAKFMPRTVESQRRAAKFLVDSIDNGERNAVRRAIVEGQATLVQIDYMLGDLVKDRPITPSEHDALMRSVETRLQVYDTLADLHDAPRVIKDAQRFPYREGLAFEMEVTRKSDRRSAFAGVFARPPQTTYEVLEPDAYLSGKKSPVVTIPDLQPVLKGEWEPYDSGTMGEFDAYIMARDFGMDNDIYSVAQRWDGGSYVVAKRAAAGKGENAAKLRTSDLALLYLSRWRTPEAARRFMLIYKNALLKRLNVTDESVLVSKCRDEEPCNGAISGERMMTDEGPVFLELWPRNTVLITQSFDDDTVAKLRPLVLTPAPGTKATAKHELSMSLYECGGFVALQQKLHQAIMTSLADSLKQ